MDLVIISSLGVPQSSMAVLANAGQGDVSDLATFIPAVANVLSFRQPLNDLPGWLLQSALTEAKCSDPADWELILSGFVNVSAATSAGLAYLESLSHTRMYTALVLMFVANGSSKTLTIDPTNSSSLYSDFGDPLLAPTSIAPGTVGAFLFGSKDLEAGAEGAMLLDVETTGQGLAVGWLDPHSGANGCALAAFPTAYAPPMNQWYQGVVIGCGGTTTAQAMLATSTSASAAIDSASGPVVTMAVSVTDNS